MCHDLPWGHPDRKILHEFVLEQLQRARSLTRNTRVWTATGRYYPHGFSNVEQLPLTVSGPGLQEFPLFKDTYFFDGNDPGAVRVVYSNQPGNEEYDVIYHNPHRKIRREDGTLVNGFSLARLENSPQPATMSPFPLPTPVSTPVRAAALEEQAVDTEGEDCDTGEEGGESAGGSS